MGEGAGRKFRLRGRGAVGRVFAEGLRARDGRMVLLGARNELGATRVGIAVSARHGCAVRRNRIKRLCREAVRLSGDELPEGWDFVVLPAVGVEADVEGLRSSLAALAGQVTRPRKSSEQRR